MSIKQRLSAGSRLAVAVTIASLASPLHAQQPDAAAPVAGEEAMVDSPFFKVGWPKLEMPKFSWKPSAHSGPAPAAGPTENPVSRALDKVAASSKKASDGVRNAWGSAMGKLSSLGGGGGKPSGPSANDDQPGFFARLFTPEPPRAPETMSEWIAQDRVGTVNR